MDIHLVNQNLAHSRVEKVKNQAVALADKAQKEKELKEACAGFEAIFLHSMVKSMRETLPGDALFEESHGTGIYKSMYDQYLSDELSKSRNALGVKEFLYQQLKDSI